MTDLTNIFGGPWSPPVEIPPDPPEIQLAQAMRDAGINPPDQIRIDGNLHRFQSGTKGRPGEDKAGWYVAFPDGVPAGRFGCWRAGIEVTWRADVGRQLSAAEEMGISRRVAEAQAARDKEREKKQETTAAVVADIWAGGIAADPDHPYLKRKGIQPHGARLTGDGRLMVPMMSGTGEQVGMQYIAADGDKKYHPGSVASGAFWVIGGETPTIYIAEGFATAATVHEVSGQQVFVAFSASNLPKIAKYLREKHGITASVIVVADNDAHGVGKNYADQAAAQSGVAVVIPPISGMDANDYHLAGHDLAALLQPQQAEWLVSADDWSAKPAPISWLVKNWLQQDALIMVHGPSGSGKTFQALDWALRIASGGIEWRGNRVKDGAVVYLAGEGHHGLRARLAAWKHHHGVGKCRMWLSRTGCDLNTAEGYLKATAAIRALPEPPCIVIVDTLHRFLNGDENSAQDTKTMLDACAGLMREHGCSVLLVHHTGVSDEAQHRARGSSAWRGALDIEISIVPPKGESDEIEIVQRKAKDSEQAAPVWARLDSVQIPGWLDEDGDPVTSAVMVEAVAPVRAEKKDSKHGKHVQMLRAAWEHAGAEERCGKPYISRSGFCDYLVGKMGLAENTAKKYAKPSSQGRPISDLLIGGVIMNFEHGWVIEDAVLGSSWMMARGEK